MSKAFLELVAEDFYNKQSPNYPNSVLIFPNKRMIAYFRKYLGQTIGKSEFSPFIYTIEAFVKDNIKLNTPDRLNLIFKLYDSYKEELKNFAQPLDIFYNFAETLLNDFNELDSYLIKAPTLFTNIKNLNELSDTFDYLTDKQIKILQQFWNYFEKEKLNADKDKFLKLWEAIPNIYSNFSAKLIEQKQAYPGLMLRLLYEKFKQNIPLKKHYFIVGFNALNEAHLRIFELMAKNGNAHFYWDYDNYYIKNEIKEAGLFLRKNLKRLSKYSIQLNNEENIEKNSNNWEFIGIPGRITQVEYAAQLIQNFKKDENVGLILPDEKMLFPVLHNIPSNIESFNITMGYPFTSTNLHHFLTTFFKLHQYRLEFSDEESTFFPIKQLKEIIHNNLIKSLLQDINSELENYIDHTNQIRIKKDNLKTNEHPIFNKLFTDTKSGSQLLKNVLSVLYSLFLFYKNKENENVSIESEFIIQTYNELNRLNELIERPDINITLTIKLCLQTLANLSIPFTGEKLENLQIMGLMETRSIDFDHVIIIDSNEGILPNITKSSSFIPQLIRKAFELPITAYQDSIFSYLFYRLLQHSKKVYILYNNIKGGNSSGEKSRYLSQIEHELNLSKNQQLKLDIKPQSVASITIERNKKINSVLAKYISKNGNPKNKVTATFLTTYLKCRLQFYFKYIANLKPLDTEDADELSHKHMGNILHNTLSKSYKIIIDKHDGQFSKNHLNFLNSNLDEIIRKEILNNYDVTNFDALSGGQKLNEAIVKSYAKEVFKHDTSAYENIKILELEEQYKYSTKFPFQIEEELFYIELSGTIDRIDKTQFIRIIDYKTGATEKKFSSIAELFSEETSKYSAIFQVLLYSYIYYKQIGDMPMANIYDLRAIKTKNFNPAIFKGKETYLPDSFMSELQDFEEHLKNLLLSIFHSEQSFYQTENNSNCTFCAYKSICKR